MRSDSDRNMSALLTRITRQVSRTFDLNLSLSIQEVLYCYSSAMTSSCFHIHSNQCMAELQHHIILKFLLSRVLTTLFLRHSCTEKWFRIRLYGMYLNARYPRHP